MKPTRTQRLNSEYEREIAAILAGELKNRVPDMKGIISVTEADVAPDLKTAKIYISILAANGEDEAYAFSAIRENAGFIRHELSKVMKMRTVPFLTFIKDESMEYGSKMDALLAQVAPKDEEV